MTTLSESTVESAALEWLSTLGWQTAHGPDIAPDTPGAERAAYGQVVLEQCLREAFSRLNRSLPASALDDALRRLTHPEGATLEARNRSFHRMLVAGMTVEYRPPDGNIRGEQARVIDFDDWAANDWLAVNQFTVAENQNTRRPDVVLFVNGLPLGVIELKNPTDEDATVWTAWQQLQTYKVELPSLFSMNEALIVSDGLSGPHRHPLRRQGVVQTLAHHHRRVHGGYGGAGAAGPPGRHLLPRALPGPGAGTSSSSMTTAAAIWSRRWRDTTSSMQSAPPWMRRCGRRTCRSPRSVPRDGTSWDGIRAEPPATAASVLSGIPRGRAKA